MADGTLNCGPRDSNRVNLSDDYEVRYWTKKFGVSKAELEQAIQKAGPMTKNVEAELQNRKRTAQVRSLPM
jgi:hypothetical protein